MDLAFFLSGERFRTDKKVRCGNCSAYVFGDGGTPDIPPTLSPEVTAAKRGACKRHAPNSAVALIPQGNKLASMITSSFPLVHPDQKCMDFTPRKVEHRSTGLEIVDTAEDETKAETKTGG